MGSDSDSKTDNKSKSEDEKKNTTLDLKAGLNEVFSKTTLIFVVLFLVIYFVAYMVIHKFGGGSSSDGGVASDQQKAMALSRTVDFVLVALILFGCVYYLMDLKNTADGDLVRNVLVWTRDYFDNPDNLVALPLFIIIFYSIVYLCQIPMAAGTKPYTISFLENKLWIFFGLLVVLLAFKYVLNISLNDYIMNHLIYWWDGRDTGDLSLHDKDKDKDKKDKDKDKKDKDASGNKTSSDKQNKEEVFNISTNVYTYEDGRAVCSAMGARLATYDEVEQAYMKGGEWCNYGWSENQMALFPTQKTTWTALQGQKGHENDCGRPGVNGGHIANPSVQFGVNCFGKRPAATDDDLTRLKANSVSPEVAAAQNDPIEQIKVQYWKNHADQFLKLNAFNRTQWNEYPTTSTSSTKT
jgi:hypothetical protein